MRVDAYGATLKYDCRSEAMVEAPLGSFYAIQDSFVIRVHRFVGVHVRFVAE